MVFKRTVEDFVCEHCGTPVIGTGFTNHCPKCLWSKHVDVHPGDRAEACSGMMEPVALEGSSPTYDIVHVCQKCGLRRRNRTDAQDDSAALLAVVRKAAA
jgi:hypothetical protein